MDCQTCKQLLSRFLDNELDKKQQLLMTKHIEDCPACAQSLESISEMVSMMHKIKAVNPPADFVSKVNKRLDELPFWEKVLLGIKNFFFSNPPVKSFALLATLIIVFAFTGQLNMHNGKKEIIEQSAAVKKSRQSSDSLLVNDFSDGMAEKQADAGAEIMLREPSGSIPELAETDTSAGNVSTAVIEKPAADNLYIKANADQVLVLELDDRDDLDTIKTILSKQRLIALDINKEGEVNIFSFKTDYENFLRLHSLLAGFGQLEKTTPNVEFHDNSDNSISWQKKAFKQLISVRLEILQ